MAKDPGSYRIPEDRDVAELERRRLEALGRLRDPATLAIFEELGVGEGWRCLEVGGGAGSVARWLARRVGPSGSVLSTDVDLRFHGRDEPPLEIRRHDVTRDPLPADHFDLVHARAVLQHLPERELALDRMVAAARPGGWIVVEDSDWQTMESQEVPEPFQTLSRLMQAGSLRLGRDPYWGRRLLAALQARGLEHVEARGQVWTMRGGTDAADWYVLAMEYAGPQMVASGAVTREQCETALAQARSPDFAILSPLSFSAWGRKPG